MPRRGLPESVSMRHDQHYVEALAASAGTPVGRLVPIDLVDPNPNQPRQVMGDLSELIASIGEKGIIEPLIVRQRGDRFQIIAGERRYQAAVQAGLRDLPVVVREVDDTEVIELALIENLQRKDLTPFEEAEALQLPLVTARQQGPDVAVPQGRHRRPQVVHGDALGLADVDAPEERDVGPSHAPNASPPETTGSSPERTPTPSLREPAASDTPPPPRIRTRSR